ncbi:DinB family protein [Rhodohalobacter sp. 614A]|uniref:DinB family protein n=1 Tax=Rhodohalobacter sp. 614A TaxID=2908649 RepID=UPI001F403F22|nr:DinB family protein [Rhodohalobacter sp. 614A]
MRNDCLKIFEKIEAQRHKMVALLDSLSDDQLHFSSEPGKWNPLQIAFHVMTAERLSVISIKRKVNSQKDFSKSGFKSAFRMIVLKLALNSSLKFKAPKRTDATGINPDYDKLKADWKSVRADLKELIHSLDESTMKSEIFNHPRVGMINMKQTLEFMETHLAHHIRQMQGIMNHPSFPSGG